MLLFAFLTFAFGCWLVNVVLNRTTFIRTIKLNLPLRGKYCFMIKNLARIFQLLNFLIYLIKFS